MVVYVYEPTACRKMEFISALKDSRRATETELELAGGRSDSDEVRQTKMNFFAQN